MSKPDFALDGKTVLITGGAGAIGRAIAEGFAAAGSRVALLDLDPERTSAVAQSLGEGHRGWDGDLRNVATLPALVDDIEGALGPIDILVNAAGLLKRTYDLFAIGEEDWDLQHDVNLKATFFMCQAVARRMSEAGRAGSIINYTSQGWMSGGYHGSIVYNSAKGGVTTITRGLARTLAPRIRVNAIAPGLVRTPMMMDESSPEQVAEWERSIPLNRLAEPGDHVGATLFLASDQAAYITGATLNVTGGFLMY